MTDAPCGEMQLLLQADIDGELTPAEAARIGAHIDRCPDCAQAQAAMLAVSDQVRRSAPRYQASPALKAAVRARLAEATQDARHGRPPAFGTKTAFGGGLALAACLALFLVAPRILDPQTIDLPEAVVSAHIRALQPGHLMDVVSTDQHTVKPWFDGRLPFAPPVKDLRGVGFPLAGGRLDYLAGHTAAGLVYRHDAHDINLFVWPDPGGSQPAHGARDGYNFEQWKQDGMVFWAVTDMNAKDLADFVERWRAS